MNDNIVHLQEDFRSGVLSGVKGVYFGDVLVSIFLEENNSLFDFFGIDKPMSSYYGGALAGGISGITINHLDPIANNILFTIAFVFATYYFSLLFQEDTIMTQDDIINSTVFDMLVVIIIVLAFSTKSKQGYMINYLKKRNLPLSSELQNMDNHSPDVITTIVVSGYVIFSMYARNRQKLV